MKCNSSQMKNRDKINCQRFVNALLIKRTGGYLAAEIFCRIDFVSNRFWS